MSRHNRSFISYFSKLVDQLSMWKIPSSSSSSRDFQVIDFFSGCGGMSLGFEALGRCTGAFELVGGVDIDQTSLATYSSNFNVPGVRADVRDVASSDSTFRQVVDRLVSLDPDKPLVLIGCAPCQGFSGHRKRKWNSADERNNLIAAFADVAIRLKPEIIVMENVPELLSERYWSYFESFRGKLIGERYEIKQTILNAAEFGVPQERFRAVVVATRNRPFRMPSPVYAPTQFRSVRDAIGDLPHVEAGEELADDPMHRSAAHRKSTIDVIRAVPKDGGSRPAGVGPKCLDRVKGYYDVYGRLYWDKPSITITHYARNPASGRFVHPEQDRGLTKREAARLQSFPDGFRFEGTFDDIFRQIGEAVPPILSAAIASAALESLRNEVRDGRDDAVITTPVNDSYSGVIAGIKMGRQ